MGSLNKGKACATMKASVTPASLFGENSHPLHYQTFSLLFALLISLWEWLRLYSRLPVILPFSLLARYSRVTRGATRWTDRVPAEDMSVVTPSNEDFYFVGRTSLHLWHYCRFFHYVFNYHVNHRTVNSYVAAYFYFKTCY